MYEKLTDEEVIEKYKAGDENALDFLLAKYKSLASKISRSYFLIGAESEDILQEAMIGLYSACRKYDKAEGTSFKTFASLCINRAVLSAIKTANRQKNKILNESFSLSSQGSVVLEKDGVDDLCIYIPSNEAIPEDALIARERAGDLNRAINEELSKKEKSVLNLYLQGLSYVEIAERLGETTKSVDNAISRTKKKLEEFLNN